MSFSPLLAIKPKSMVEERLLSDIREIVGTKRINAEYFDFYLDEDEDYVHVKRAIESFGFVVEFLFFDEQLIYRTDMREFRLPPTQMLRIYNGTDKTYCDPTI
jgi:hypothetical protein